MGLFSTRSSNKTSTSTVNNVNDHDISGADYRQLEQGVIEGNVALSGVDGDVNINRTDHGAIDKAFSAVSGAVSDVAGLVNDTLDVQGSHNREFLGVVDNFADISANLSYQSSLLSAQQTADALDFAHRTNDNTTAFAADALTDGYSFASAANTNMAVLAADAMGDAYAFASDANDNITALSADAMGHVASAYGDANDGLLAMNSEYLEHFAANQTEAMNLVAKNSAVTADATKTAMDYVFESGKSETERMAQHNNESIVWIAIAAVALPLLVRVIK